MGRRRKRWTAFSDAEVSLVWQRWRDGVRIDGIAKELERSIPSVKCLVVRHGGIPPQARRRSTFPLEPTLHVSHETIYRTLYVQTRDALKRELVAHLRRSTGYRKRRKTVGAPDRRGQLVDAIPISARPAEAADRAVPGHWEGDLLAGTKWSNIGTLVERHSRYVMLVRLPDRNAPTVARAIARRIQQSPTSLKQPLTWDRGKEMAQHKAFTIATDVQVYFCDPSSPWQRGSNENTNGLLRQYLPKGKDVSHFAQRQLDAIALKLNARPRQTLDWKTPAETFAAAVAATG